ncbi:brachyurin-like isoform X2 [Bacillus rossius redtenbacheri]
MATLSAVDTHTLEPSVIHGPKTVGGPGRPAARIVGGVNAATGQFPFVTAITMDDSFFCTSSLLSHNWILTAAHCAVEASTFGVKLGITNFLGDEDGVVTTKSRKVVVNPNYNTVNSSFDIALIMLASPVTYTSRIQPVKLPSRSSASSSLAGTAVREMGWGISDDFPTTVSPVLNYVDMHVISNEECSKSFPGFIDSTIICAIGANMKGACGGDSGGPLVTDYDSSAPVLVGVADFVGYQGCWGGEPTGFARVSYHLDWIHSATGIAVRS